MKAIEKKNRNQDLLFFKGKIDKTLARIITKEKERTQEWNKGITLQY